MGLPPNAIASEFFKKVKNNGALILRKDNPSGLSENDKSMEISVIFKE